MTGDRPMNIHSWPLARKWHFEDLCSSRKLYREAALRFLRKLVAFAPAHICIDTLVDRIAKSNPRKKQQHAHRQLASSSLQSCSHPSRHWQEHGYRWREMVSRRVRLVPTELELEVERRKPSAVHASRFANENQTIGRAVVRAVCFMCVQTL